MVARRLAVVVALLAVGGALVAAAVREDASLALWTAVGVGLVAVAGGGLALVAGVRRLALLGRYVVTRPMDVGTAAGLDAGTRWLRVAGTVGGASDRTSVLSSGAVAGRTLRLERRTHPFDLKWPGVDRRLLGEETDLGPLALVDGPEKVHVAADGSATVAAPTTRESFGADHEPSFELVQAVQRHDRTFGAVVGDGALGQHRLHVTEGTLAPGDPVELFGLLTVDRDGVTRLAAAEGRGGEVALGHGRRLPLRYLRGAVAGVAGGAVLLALAWFVLAPVLG